MFLNSISDYYSTNQLIHIMYVIMFFRPKITKLDFKKKKLTLVVVEENEDGGFEQVWQLKRRIVLSKRHSKVFRQTFNLHPHGNDNGSLMFVYSGAHFRFPVAERESVQASVEVRRRAPHLLQAEGHH